MYRYKITLCYDGSEFYGFQVQNTGVRTVQGELNRVVNKIAEKSGQTLKVVGASRTDSGVHANGQVAHFDFPYDIPEHAMYKALNSKLPFDIVVKKVEKVADDFNSRFDTTGKRYYYRLALDEYVNPFKRKYTGHCFRKLDVSKIQEALPDLLGEHDFASFAAAGNQSKTTIRTVTKAEVIEDLANNELIFVFEGNAFLYNQIRIMVGVLIEIGLGKRPVHDIIRLLEIKDRQQARFTADGAGLYLDEIYYKKNS